MLKTRQYVGASAMLLLCAGACPALGATAGENPQEILIDFEGFTELTPIQDQYANLGVTFELSATTDLPVISVQGFPATAFRGYDGSDDTPFVSGVSGLTDPPGRFIIDSHDMILHFAKPAQRVSFWVIDIDGGGTEHWTDRCTVSASDDLGVVIDTMTLDANDPGTGDLAHTLFEMVAPAGSDGIFRIDIDVTDDMGYAIDDLRFTLMAQGGGPDDGPGGGDDPPAGGGGGGTPGIVHRVNPIGQETLEHIFVFGRAFVTSEPDGGQTYAAVPFENGAFEVQADLLPCGVPVFWTIIGTGPFGNTVRFGGRLDPIIRRPFADLTLDGTVDTADLGVMIAAFGNGDPSADINGDGFVDTADLGALIGAFGSTCHE